MFYSDKTRSYRLLGVFRFERGEVEGDYNEGRQFSSMGFRLRGQSSFSFGEKRCIAEEKSIIYIPAGVDYLRSGGNEEMIVVHLECCGKDDEDISVLYADGAEAMFEAILSDWESGSDSAYNRCMSRVYRIFEMVEKAKRPPKESPSEVIAVGVRYLREHYRDTELTVAKLAALCHVSEVYFRRMYQRCFGTSPWQTILEMRFSYACNLLQSNYYTIKEISTMSGFSDVKYFRRAFGKRFGRTPTEYAESR